MTSSVVDLASDTDDNTFDISAEYDSHLRASQRAFYSNQKFRVRNATWFERAKQTWLELQETFRFTEYSPVWETNRVPPPFSKKMCFSLCDKDELICADTLEDYVDRDSSRNPFMSTPRCPNRKPLPFYATIGYSQAGSTFFTGALTLHDDITKACRKEIHYFEGNLVREAGLESNAQGVAFEVNDYLRCMNSPYVNAPHLLNGTVVGDNTIKEIYVDAFVPMWYKAINPEIKLFVLLRNPAKRAFSRYSMLGGGHFCSKFIKSDICKHNFDAYVPTMIDFIRKECPNLTPRGDPSAAYSCASGGANREDTDTIVSNMYYHHLRHWLNFFPASQFLVLESDKLFADPRGQINRAYEFLGLPAMDEQTYAQKRAAVVVHQFSHSKKSKPSQESMDLLAAFYRPYLDELKVLARQEFGIPDLTLIH